MSEYLIKQLREEMNINHCRLLSAQSEQCAAQAAYDASKEALENALLFYGDQQ